MNKINLNIFIVLLFILLSNYSKSQNYISFRNTLNEANYWFYEGHFDSSLVYYQKAEKFKLPFYPEETHLYSRNLWELGYKKKSIKFLVSNDGLKDFFLKDTTYYPGLNLDTRKKIASKLKKVEQDLLVKNIDFYEALHKKVSMYRNILVKFKNDSKEFDSIEKLMVNQDSLNLISLINEIKLNGYPGGYVMAPIGPGAVLIHSKPEWLLNYYKVFINEIEAGRMNYYDFSPAIDRMFVKFKEQSQFNSYIPLEESEIHSPILIFINRCSIGMSPYYDIYLPRLYPRGKTPQKSKLYDYYKKSKQNFNCIKIK